MNSSNLVELNNITKIFYINNNKNPIYALDKINFKIKKGDKIGIIGDNGAGKTTLLKIIAGIIKPTQGTANIYGKVISLMNLEDGFKLDLSGRENILLNGLLVGMTKIEIDKKIEEIIDYSGISKYIDEPFYTYSAGMKFRLSFSVAIASNCDVLILDEVLTAGDFSFQEKSFKSLAALQKNKKIATVVCSHIPDIVWGFSDKYFLLNKGKIKQLTKEEMANVVIKRHNAWNTYLDLRELP